MNSQNNSFNVKIVIFVYNHVILTFEYIFEYVLQNLSFGPPFSIFSPAFSQLRSGIAMISRFLNILVFDMTSV